MGAKLWIEDRHGGMVVAGGRKELVGKIHKYIPPSSRRGIVNETSEER